LSLKSLPIGSIPRFIKAKRRSDPPASPSGWLWGSLTLAPKQSYLNYYDLLTRQQNKNTGFKRCGNSVLDLLKLEDTIDREKSIFMSCTLIHEAGKDG